MAQKKIYKALKRLWSNSQERIIEAGEPIDLSQATEADIAALIEVGAIDPSAQAPQPAPKSTPVEEKQHD